MFKDLDGKWKHTEEEKEKARKESKKLIWYTDGTVNKRLKENETPPEGFKVGRTIDWKFTTEGTIQTEESNRKRSEKLLGRPSPNKGNPSPKKGMTELEYYKDPELVAKLAEERSKVHKGQPAWNKGIPCREETKQKISAANIYSEDRESVLYKRWAKQVHANNNNKCQHCAKDEQTKLKAHHIKGWNDFPTLRLDVSNGLTLCGSCHYRLEASIAFIARNFLDMKTFILAKDIVVCSSCHRLTFSDKEGIIICSCLPVKSAETCISNQGEIL